MPIWTRDGRLEFEVTLTEPLPHKGGAGQVNDARFRIRCMDLWPTAALKRLALRVWDFAGQDLYYAGLRL